MTGRSTAAVLVVAALALGACGVPTDDEAATIDPATLPAAIRSDATTTTTTTEPALPVTQEVVVHFLITPIDTERTQVAPVTRELPVEATIVDKMSLLFGADRVTPEDEAGGIFNSLFEFALLGVEVDDDVATVDIVNLTPDGEPSQEPFTGDLADVGAQLVFTATGFDGVRQVRILISGEPVSIPTNDVDPAEPGSPLDRSNYELYDPTT